MRIYEGKLKLIIEKGSPYYSTADRERYKVLFNHFGWNATLWLCFKERKLTKEATFHLRMIFPQCEIADGRKVYYNEMVYYLDDMRWLFNRKYAWRPTTHPCVMYDLNSNRYFGYSHRAAQGFGIGDILFNPNEKIDTSFFYKQPKYRWKYIKALIKYHIKGDWQMFQDICEDDIIGHGIMQIVPFRDKGTKRIKTFIEAFQAARNFAEYVS